MTQFAESLPSELVTHVKAGCGARGEAWLAELPETIKALEEHWSITVHEPFPGIEFNFVAPATSSGGANVVLKIAPPWETIEIFCEAAYLRERKGVGCVKFLAEHHESRAILIERIFPGKSLWQHFTDREAEAVKPAIDALKMVLKPIPPDIEHIDSLDRWFEGLRNFADTKFPADYAGKALEIYVRLSKQPGRQFYLHGDYHPGNIVTHGESGFCVIDPKGLTGHIGYEIAVFLNNFHWWQEAKSNTRPILAVAIYQFAEAFEIDAFELREWAFAQMVIGSWWNFVDMPELYDGGVVKADIWDV